LTSNITAATATATAWTTPIKPKGPTTTPPTHGNRDADATRFLSYAPQQQQFNPTVFLYPWMTHFIFRVRHGHVYVYVFVFVLLLCFCYCYCYTVCICMSWVGSEVEVGMLKWKWKRNGGCQW
jgi:hypothetical protein